MEWVCAPWSWVIAVSLGGGSLLAGDRTTQVQPDTPHGVAPPPTQARGVGNSRPYALTFTSVHGIPCYSLNSGQNDDLMRQL